MRTLIFLGIIFPLFVTQAKLDVNQNELSDLWEQQYAPIPLPLEADPDSDGRTTAEEEEAGTDPLDAQSVLELQDQFLFDQGGLLLRVNFPTLLGKEYTLAGSTFNPNLIVEPAAPYVPGTGERIFMDIPWTQKCTIYGGVTAEFWSSIPSDVTSPNDLNTTSTPPDGTAGLHRFTDEIIQFPYAAMRIHGYLRQSSSGEVVYGLSSDGQAVFEFDPNGREGSDLAPLLEHDSLARKTAPPVEQEAGVMHAVVLTYLPNDPQHPSISLSLGPDDTDQTIPSGNQLLFWYDRDDQLDEFFSQPGWWINAEVRNLDSDADGVDDWEEFALNLSPITSTSFGFPDDLLAPEFLAADNVVQIIQPAENVLIEELEDSVDITLKRLLGNGTPFTLPLTVNGQIEAADLSYLPGNLSFAADQWSSTLTVKALADDRLEPSELGELTLGNSAGTLVVGGSVPLIIQDETDPEPILYVALYGPQAPAVTPASGFASILLAANRNTAWVSSEFNNLTSPQTTAHIHLEDDNSIVEGLPSGTFSDFLWDLTTPANMNMPSMNLADGNHQFRLDALDNNRLYANVHSVTYPAGEIRGTFSRATGSVNFDPPPHVDPDEGAPDASEMDAFRFLQQASFGPTSESVAEVMAMGIDAWINAEITKPISRSIDYQTAADTAHRALTGETFNQAQPTHRRNLTSAWFTRAIHGRDQLRQRMAFAWSQIFVTSILDSGVATRTYGLGSYHDMLAENVFGNFRDFLEDVTRHPIMGIYLSSLKNERENTVLGTKPDENYAREIMQLFTIGLLEQHPDGSLRLDEEGRLIQTYTNNDITELARVFTGFSFSYRHNSNQPYNENLDFYYYGGPLDNQMAYQRPMKLFHAYHDKGPKTILKTVEIPGSLQPDEELDVALDAIFNHPNTPPFIARLLIQRLVTSNPSRGYVYRVAQAFENNGAGVRGDLVAVTKAIFLDQEARSETFYNRNNYGKLKEPLLAHVQVCRAVGVSNDLPLSALPGLSLLPYDADAIRYAWANCDHRWGQTPFRQPSVFNWFLPDYSPNGPMRQARLYAPEFQIATDNNIILSLNNFTALPVYANTAFGFNTGVHPGVGVHDDNIHLDVTPLFTLDRPTLVQWCDQRLLGGHMSDFLREQLTTELDGLDVRPVEATIALLLNSPEFWIQR